MTIKIFLGNLNSDTTPDKIRPLFEKYGEVVECDVLKNFGFVHMVNKSDANKAIAQLDGHNVDGNNIRVELSTGKRGGGGGGGKFDKRGYGGSGGRSRPYGMGPGRGDFDRYPFSAMGAVGGFDRYDPYYRYYLERESYYARMAPMGGDRGFASGSGRDRFSGLAARDRFAGRSYMDERNGRGLASDPYMRDREAIGARPPPEYYDS